MTHTQVDVYRLWTDLHSIEVSSMQLAREAEFVLLEIKNKKAQIGKLIEEFHTSVSLDEWDSISEWMQ